MKINKISEYCHMLTCPICKADFAASGNKSLICVNNHCYDIAKQGYVNFASSKEFIYSEELFEHRHMIFEAGFYQPLVDKINEIIDKYENNKKLREQAGNTLFMPHSINEMGNTAIIDAGCGEGYFIKSICKDMPCHKLAFDISKEAVRMASRGITDTAWMTADTGSIPVKDGCVDVVLNILAPANYSEFNRICKKEIQINNDKPGDSRIQDGGGIVIKAVPGSAYLSELRQLAGEGLQNKSYDNTAIFEHFKNNINLISKEEITYTMPINYQQAVSFSKMTPMLSKIDEGSLPLKSLNEITIDLDIFIGKTL